jgi:aerobic carbon-monoxide dehydrogenase medium subunit
VTGTIVSWIAASRHRMGPFTLHRPTTITEAAGLLEELDGTVRLLAGGVDLLNELKGGAPCDHLIDLARIDALRGVRANDHHVEIGASVSHREVERSSELAERFPGVPGIWSGLGNVRVRHAGTVVGNLVAGLTRYDVYPVAVCLGGSTVGVDGTVRPVGEGFTTGLVTALRLPPSLSGAIGYQRAFKPMLSCAVSLSEGEAGWQVRAAFGCVPFGPAMSVAAGGRGLGELAVEAADVAGSLDLRDAEFPDDAYASERYRRRLAPVLVQRLVKDLAEHLLQQEDDR